MTSRQRLNAVDQALAEVFRRLACGELDETGRYYIDEELAAGAAAGGKRAPAKPVKVNAAWSLAVDYRVNPLLSVSGETHYGTDACYPGGCRNHSQAV